MTTKLQNKTRGESASLKWMRETIDALPISLNTLTCIVGLSAALPIIWKKRQSLGLRSITSVVLWGFTFLVCFFGGTVVFYMFESILGGQFDGFGVSLLGIYFVGAPVLLLILRLLKRDIKKYFDVYALCALLGSFIARFRCMINGCCDGKKIFSLNMRWPVREAELLFYLILFGILWRIDKKDNTSGQLFPIMMASYGIFRFVNEWFREAAAAPSAVHIAHVWTILCIIIGASIYYELRLQTGNKKLQRNKKGRI